MITLLVVLGACAPPADPPEVVVGERLFLEPRFAEFFAANAGGELNAELAQGDPTLDVVERDAGDVAGPFAGSTMSCRQCHLVDEVHQVRTYADLARRSPIPDRGDGLTTTVRNSPALTDMSIDREAVFILHFDGEFPSAEALVRGTFTGRNLGWLPFEHDEAVAHIAAVVRADDGTFPVAADGATLPYATLLAGTDAEIPDRMRLPEALRIDVDTATDDEILDAVAALVAAYLRNIQFSRGLESGLHNGSPYDAFLAANDLPRAPEAGEDAFAYVDRLRTAVADLDEPHWITDVDDRFGLHRQPFAFQEAELRGLRVFLRTPASAAAGESVGNCVACHLPPTFTDYGLHNTGVSQEAYDAVWGEGAFATLAIPDLAARDAAPDAWLPPSPAHPTWQGGARAIPTEDRPGAVDLGAWSIFGNDDHPAAQDGLRGLIDEAYALDATTDDATRLAYAIGLFKTPSVRDLAQSAPYLHDGSVDDLDAVLAHYVRVAELKRSGALRNGDPRLAGIELTDDDLADLRAFLDALTEDYD